MNPRMSPPRRFLIPLALVLAAPVLARAQPPVVAADEVRALLRRSGAVLVDVRTPQEYAQMHILGAIGIPADRIRAEAARLPRDRSTTLVFYCRGAG